MSAFPYVKLLHISCVLLSGCGFVLRGVWMLRDPRLLRAHATRTLPHVVDTLLLASALALASMSGQYPFVQPWLTSKVLGLLLYIVLGIAAFRGPTRRARLAAWLAAMAVFSYIVLVALRRDPLGPFSLL